ncbi:hypothetical protein [Mucilaginibacter xinganensis]|uniref:Uncharacterized protein n=1 Tax=Mucilaginibacter xinganensis TaxID=1234841 RepID=A0A223NYQ8_9SPHI|nr:hypothetical protein [Mucilaginibacter xinganensis]ASU34966.1 hypothetical protein MuYL_3081 [Mucilaginibacter xinganensis]
MEHTKTWKTTTPGQYLFTVNQTEIGRMTIEPGTIKRKAIIVIGGEKYQLLQTGFWKTSVGILDDKGNNIGKVYAEKWYADAMRLDLYRETYKLVFRNNPLAEFAITQCDQDVLAYGLKTGSGNTSLKITSADPSANYLLDFILWYWFIPVAIENIISSDGIYETHANG